MKSIYLVLFTAILLLSEVQAQKISNCPSNSANPENNSLARLDSFLTADGYESHRVKKGLDNLQYSNIELLTGSSYSCYKLNYFKSTTMTSISSTAYTYYKVSNYYFIVTWSTVKSTKPTNILVFDDQYNLHTISLL